MDEMRQASPVDAEIEKLDRQFEQGSDQTGTAKEEINALVLTYPGSIPLSGFGWFGDS